MNRENLYAKLKPLKRIKFFKNIFIAWRKAQNKGRFYMGFRIRGVDIHVSFTFTDDEHVEIHGKGKIPWLQKEYKYQLRRIKWHDFIEEIINETNVLLVNTNDLVFREYIVLIPKPETSEDTLSNIIAKRIGKEAHITEKEAEEFKKVFHVVQMSELKSDECKEALVGTSDWKKFVGVLMSSNGNYQLLTIEKLNEAIWNVIQTLKES